MYIRNDKIIRLRNCSVPSDLNGVKLEVPNLNLEAAKKARKEGYFSAPSDFLSTSFLRTVHEENSKLNFKTLDSFHLTCVFQVRILVILHVHTEK